MPFAIPPSSMPDQGDPLLLLEDDEAVVPAAPNAEPWRVLIVDDDEDVHAAIEFALRDVVIE